MKKKYRPVATNALRTAFSAQNFSRKNTNTKKKKKIGINNRYGDKKKGYFRW